MADKDDLESYALAIAGFIAGLKHKANPAAIRAGVRGAPGRGGRSRQLLRKSMRRAGRLSPMMSGQA